MKKLLIIIALAASTAVAHGQKVQASKVPAAVKNGFTKAYPNATNAKWEKEKDNYEVEFALGKTEYSAVLDVNGKLLETETEIKASELPAKALAHVKSNYPGKEIKEAAKITDTAGVVTYEAEVKGKDLIFDSAGNFLKESK